MPSLDITAPAPPSAILPQHARLFASQNSRRILSLPLIQGVECVAIMTLEWHGEHDCTPENIAWLEAYGALLPTILEDKRQAERGYLAKAYSAFKDIAAKLFGPRHLLWKTATVATARLLAPYPIDVSTLVCWHCVAFF
jgi:hypothetical protein